MMVYTYFCDTCKKTVEVTKAVKNYNRVETCKCGEVMRKVFSVGGIKTNDGVKI